MDGWLCLKQATAVEPRDGMDSVLNLHVCKQYGEGAGNTIEENSSIFSLSLMH